MADFIQVGVTALRDPATGELLPAVPLYVRTEDAEAAALAGSEEAAADHFAAWLADLMRRYVSGCRSAGVPI